MNIKLSYVIGGSATLGIRKLDSSMRTSKCSSPTRNGPLTIGFDTQEPKHLNCGPCKTAIAEHHGVSHVPAGGGLTSLEMKAL